MFAYCGKNGVQVSSTSAHGGFSFVFYREMASGVSENAVGYRAGVDNQVLGLLKENPAQTREQLAERIGKTVRTIQRALDRLSDDGIRKRIGSNRSGRSAAPTRISPSLRMLKSFRSGV